MPTVFGYVDSAEDQYGSAESDGRDRSFSTMARADQRHQRYEINIVACFDCAQMLDRRIPDCETEQRGHKSQKEQVARHDRIAEQCGVEPERREGENGQQGDNAVEEYFARDLER